MGDLRNPWFSLGHGPGGGSELGALLQHQDDGGLVVVTDGSVDRPDAVLVDGFDVRSVVQQDFEDPCVGSAGGVVERRPLAGVSRLDVEALLDEEVQGSALAADDGPADGVEAVLVARFFVGAASEKKFKNSDLISKL